VERLHQINSETKLKAISDRHLRVDTNHDKGMLLFTSIPYEPGWTVRVNGQKTEISEAAGGLMAVVVPAGNNTIELKFFPHRMPLGIILSLVGLVGFVLMLLMEYFITHVKRELNEADDGTLITPVVVRKDDYDGFDPDYINLDSDYDDFDFDQIEKEIAAQEEQQQQQLPPSPIPEETPIAPTITETETKTETETEEEIKSDATDD